MPFTHSVDTLVRDLGSLIADRHALDVPSVAAKATVTKAVHDAGLAVSRTIAHPNDEKLVLAARDAIEFGKYVVGALGGEISRSRSLCDDSQLLRERAAQFLLESVSNNESRDRRHQRKR